MVPTESRHSMTSIARGVVEPGETRSVVAHVLRQVAPDVDIEAIDWETSLHDVADIDSLDFLRLVALTADVTGVTVPPRDYPLIVTLEGFARYLATRMSPAD